MLPMEQLNMHLVPCNCSMYAQRPFRSGTKLTRTPKGDNNLSINSITMLMLTAKITILFMLIFHIFTTEFVKWSDCPLKTFHVHPIEVIEISGPVLMGILVEWHSLPTMQFLYLS